MFFMIKYNQKIERKSTMNMKFNNPISEAWHADPEARIYNGKYCIYVTRSLPFEEQLNQDMFISDDLEHWEKIESIIDMSGFPWVKKAVWAPTIIEKDGKYYYIFATNDIHEDNEGGGLEIAVSDSPTGPFKGYLGKPLIGMIINGAQPIDAHLFKDDDGTIYLYYGGWKHCNVCKMNDDMTGFVPFDDGETFKEITPQCLVASLSRSATASVSISFLGSMGYSLSHFYRLNFIAVKFDLINAKKSCVTVLDVLTAAVVNHKHLAVVKQKITVVSGTLGNSLLR